MKTIKWESCINKGVVSNYTANDKRSPLPDDPVKPNTVVIARYQGVSARLKLQEEIEPNTFKASVICFDPPLATLPSDLFVGDDVCISKADICWITDIIQA